jgi:hypothetical protein
MVDKQSTVVEEASTTVGKVDLSGGRIKSLEKQAF